MESQPAGVGSLLDVDVRKQLIQDEGGCDWLSISLVYDLDLDGSWQLAEQQLLDDAALSQIEVGPLQVLDSLERSVVENGEFRNLDRWCRNVDEVLHEMVLEILYVSVLLLEHVDRIEVALVGETESLSRLERRSLQVVEEVLQLLSRAEMGLGFDQFEETVAEYRVGANVSVEWL